MPQEKQIVDIREISLSMLPIEHIIGGYYDREVLYKGSHWEKKEKDGELTGYAYENIYIIDVVKQSDKAIIFKFDNYRHCCDTEGTGWIPKSLVWLERRHDKTIGITEMIVKIPLWFWIKRKEDLRKGKVFWKCACGRVVVHYQGDGQPPEGVWECEDCGSEYEWGT